jgi:hypothetical protein
MLPVDDFQKQTIVLAIHTMFAKKSHFDICTVDECLKVAGITPPSQEKSALRAMHCVSYSDMPPGYRAELITRTVRLFEGVFTEEDFSRKEEESSLPVLRKRRWSDLFS